MQYTNYQPVVNVQQITISNQRYMYIFRGSTFIHSVNIYSTLYCTLLIIYKKLIFAFIQNFRFELSVTNLHLFAPSEHSTHDFMILTIDAELLFFLFLFIIILFSKFSYMYSRSVRIYKKY